MNCGVEVGSQGDPLVGSLVSRVKLLKVTISVSCSCKIIVTKMRTGVLYFSAVASRLPKKNIKVWVFFIIEVVFLIGSKRLENRFIMSALFGPVSASTPRR